MRKTSEIEAEIKALETKLRARREEYWLARVQEEIDEQVARAIAARPKVKLEPLPPLSKGDDPPLDGCERGSYYADYDGAVR